MTERLEATASTITADSTFTATSAPTHLIWQSSLPCTFRQVQYPDGRIVMQGGYVFGSTTEQGIKWKALPLVQVNEQGEEL